MRVLVKKATSGECFPAWYEHLVGKVVNVYPYSVHYQGGMGYMCTELSGGILVDDCEELEEK